MSAFLRRRLFSEYYECVIMYVCVCVREREGVWWGERERNKETAREVKEKAVTEVNSSECRRKECSLADESRTSL